MKEIPTCSSIIPTGRRRLATSNEPSDATLLAPLEDRYKGLHPVGNYVECYLRSQRVILGRTSSRPPTSSRTWHEQGQPHIEILLYGDGSFGAICWPFTANQKPGPCYVTLQRQLDALSGRTLSLPNPSTKICSTYLVLRLLRHSFPLQDRLDKMSGLAPCTPGVRTPYTYEMLPWCFPNQSQGSLHRRG